MPDRKGTHVNAPATMTRRGLLGKSTGAAAIGLLGAANLGVAAEQGEPAARKGRINQSVARWCYEKHWSLEENCRIARRLGCRSVELVPPEEWGTLKQYGLVCGLAASHGFEQGMNNPKYQPECIAKLRAAIDACAEHGFPNVITFTGFRENIPDDVGLENCVKAYKQVIGHAEKKKVHLCLEMLNSRVSEEMKGHPGYQGDNTEYCVEIIRRVGSPRLKLLFDVYHVQIMDGDIITRIRKYKDLIGHYHTAGNPGRGELDDRQEINYPAVMKVIAETGYTGLVGQEFIPTRDPLESLAQAVKLCDV